MNPSTLQTNYNPRHLWQGLSHSSVGAASLGGGTPPPPAGSAGVGTGAGGTAPPPPGVQQELEGHHQLLQELQQELEEGHWQHAGPKLGLHLFEDPTGWQLWHHCQLHARASFCYTGRPLLQRAGGQFCTLSTVSSCCRANFLKTNCSQQQETRRVSLKTEAAGDQEGLLNRT